MFLTEEEPIVSTERPRDPQRTIPAVEVPTLADLGLAELARPRRRTLVLFVARPVAAAGAALGLAASGRWLPALALVPLWYGWSLTLVHHMIHGSLGAPPAVRNAALAVGGALALHAGHALALTHTQHHATTGGPDPEGEIERVPLRRLPAEAVLFRYRLWVWGWDHAHGRGAIAAEVAVHATAVAYALTHLPDPLALVVAALWSADVAFAALAGRGPQTNWGRALPTPLVAVRCRLSRWLLLGHNWHLEHHLYPDVPLPALARVAPAVDARLTELGALVVRLP
jgi:beta-carotene hydroxylase